MSGEAGAGEGSPKLSGASPGLGWPWGRGGSVGLWGLLHRCQFPNSPETLMPERDTPPCRATVPPQSHLCGQTQVTGDPGPLDIPSHPTHLGTVWFSEPGTIQGLRGSSESTPNGFQAQAGGPRGLPIKSAKKKIEKKSLEGLHQPLPAILSAGGRMVMFLFFLIMSYIFLIFCNVQM